MLPLLCIAAVVAASRSTTARTKETLTTGWMFHAVSANASNSNAPPPASSKGWASVVSTGDIYDIHPPPPPCVFT